MRELYILFMLMRIMIKFAETYYKSTRENPEIVSIIAQFDGYIGKVNPEIVVYKKLKCSFDLSYHLYLRITSDKIFQHLTYNYLKMISIIMNSSLPKKLISLM